MNRSGARRWRNLQVAALAAAYLLVLPYSATHLDLARDIYVALRVARLEDAPLLGPPLAGALNLGPLWYYVLALPIALGAQWFAVLAFIAVIGALQFPLAYLAGKALHSRAAGITWAWLLLVPSWSTFETLFPGHTQWTATLTLAALVAAMRYVATGKTRYFVGLALACSLAVHAHPSALGLVWVGLGVLAFGLRRRRLRLATIVAAGLAAVAPFVPLLIDQLARGMPLLGELAGYAGSEQGRAGVSVAPTLLAQALVGGFDYWFSTVLGLDRSPVTASVALLGGVLIAGGLGLGAALRTAEFRARGVAALVAALAITLTVVMMRAYFPYYMTTVVRVTALGLVSVGLAGVLGRGWHVAMAGAILLAQFALVAGVGLRQIQGALPLAFFPLFDVGGRAPAQQPRPLLMLPAYAMSRSGSFLCSGPLGLHGAYAWHVLHSHALEGRLACGAVDVRLGGPAAAGRAAWIGLPRAVLRAAGIDAARPMGPFGLLPVRQVFGEPTAVVSPDLPRYPPVAVTTEPLRQRVFEARLSEGERLAISNLAFPFTYSGDPVIRVYADGVLLEPAGGDGVSRVWRCDGCGTARLRIEVEAGDFGHLDIVTF